MAPDDELTVMGSEEEEAYPCLEILSGPAVKGRYPLRPGKNSLGRLIENDIVLDDSSISRRHVLIEVGPQGVVLTDQGSRNGTNVDGQKVAAGQPIPLNHDTRVGIGAYQFRLLMHQAPAAVPSTVEPVTSAEPVAEPAEEPVDEPPDQGLPEPAAPSRWDRFRRPVLFLLVASFLIGAGWYFYRHLVKPKPAVPQKSAVPPEPNVEEAIATPPPPVAQPGSKRPIFLDVSSSPIAVKVFFGEKEIGQTPFRVSTDLEEGKWYEIRGVFELPDLGEKLEEKVRFEVKAGQEILPLSLNGRLGIFKISSLPRDVEIYLEGFFEADPAKAKPVKFGEVIFGKPVYIPYGRFVIELRKSRQVEGSQTFVSAVVYRREFSLNPEQTSFTLDIKDSDLELFPVEINSIPPGAKVFVDEKEVGITPYSGTFPLGDHLLTLKREGYFDYNQQIKMETNTPFVSEVTLQTSAAGEIVNRAVELIRQDRHTEALPLLVEAFNKNPSPRELAEISYLIGLCYLRQKSFKEAEDYFTKARDHADFKYQGRLGLAQVAHQQGDPVKSLQLLVEVLVSAQEAKIRSDAGILFQQLSPLKSVLYVNSEPDGAIVFVNGKEMPQRTPLILHNLGIGSYRIEIKKEGYQPSQTKLNLGVSEFKPVLVKLDPIP